MPQQSIDTCQLLSLLLLRALARCCYQLQDSSCHRHQDVVTKLCEQDAYTCGLPARPNNTALPELTYKLLVRLGIALSDGSGRFSPSWASPCIKRNHCCCCCCCCCCCTAAGNLVLLMSWTESIVHQPMETRPTRLLAIPVLYKNNQ